MIFVSLPVNSPVRLYTDIECLQYLQLMIVSVLCFLTEFIINAGGLQVNLFWKYQWNISKLMFLVVCALPHPAVMTDYDLLESLQYLVHINRGPCR